LPAMIRKFHEAKVTGTDKVVLWGDGSPYREFLYSEDLADAIVFLMENKSASDIGEFINIGTGSDLTIRDIAEKIKAVVYSDCPDRICTIEWDSTKPNGTPKKLLDVSLMSSLGWTSRTSLVDGLKLTYRDYISGLAK